MDIIELVNSKDWPLAVDPKYIVNNDEDKNIRASSILRVFVQEPLQGKKFLDFGCGDGHVVTHARYQTNDAYGYDIKANNVEGCTQDFGEIRSHGPYDIILAFDVFDHMRNQEEIIESIENLRNLSHSGTNILFRLHPWTSRHATHAYYSFNKAYAHILLEKEHSIQVLNITRPVKFYNNLFRMFKILETKRHIQTLEPILQIPEVVKEFEKKLDGTGEWQQHVLPIQFLDYKLRIC
tara:strand:- start:3690 stop:4400 length:711 start_codon:yes stop_codon:yes gene_type:complete